MGILIVDDALFVRADIAKILKQNHLEVVGEAKDGLEAIKKYQQLKPSVVLMDVTMPNMDGVTAIKEIKKIDPDAKIIVCSAIGQETSVMQAIQAGAKSYIVKPYKKERLVEEIIKVQLHQ
ncbi:response regulator [Inediibacterium massiliense]|uniref:response regulator n=1 Tax=Inediibacterium massiliense TaxID=1658111 RepID=UPI0006B58C56|nr:response regulator [Inediibacterium massiliense]